MVFFFNSAYFTTKRGHMNNCKWTSCIMRIHLYRQAIAKFRSGIFVGLIFSFACKFPNEIFLKTSEKWKKNEVITSNMKQSDIFLVHIRPRECGHLIGLSSILMSESTKLPVAVTDRRSGGSCTLLLTALYCQLTDSVSVGVCTELATSALRAFHLK